MDWSRTTVLITGAGGFIGSHLTERLVALGAQTRAFIRYNASGSWGWLDHSPVKEDVEVVLGDVRDRDSVAPAVRGADVVFHLAALIAIPYSYRAPLSYVRTNAEGTLNVLQASAEAGVGRLIHTSTSEVYGTARRVPIDETHPLQAQSPYAASKIAADKLVEAWGCSFGLPATVVRPFNTFGPRQSARAVVPTIIAQCLAGRTVQVGNLHPTRDLSYVEDIVEGFIRAAASPAAAGRTVHFGSGRETEMEELVRMIARLLDKEIDIEQQPERQRPASSEVSRLVADSRLARELLGWEAATPLEKGLELTIAWMQAHAEQYRLGAYVL